jgi:hypothetical protein
MNGYFIDQNQHTGFKLLLVTACFKCLLWHIGISWWEWCFCSSSLSLYLKEVDMLSRSWGSSVNIVSDYSLDNRGSIPSRCKGFFLCVQTGSEAHPASCTMGTGSPFPGAKCGQDMMLTTYPHLVPRSIMSRSYTSSPPSTTMACIRTALLFGHVQCFL